MRAVLKNIRLWKRRVKLDHHLPEFVSGAASWPNCPEFDAVYEEGGHSEADQLKVLLVVAHPDDESECAALLYRISHELGGIVDQVIVTNGEAGHQYSAPARALTRLTRQEPVEDHTGREWLIQTRRAEVMRAGQILGIRHQHFLEQSDTGLTFEARDGFSVWDVPRIQRELGRLLTHARYDFVFVLSPTADTHGHHQAVALLTLEALANVAAQERPALIAVKSQTGADIATDPAVSAYFTRENQEWIFDRRTPMTCHHALNYSVIVNWVIAEHKSQGLLQMDGGRRTHESFRLFALSGTQAAARWREFATRMTGAGALSETKLETVPRREEVLA